MRRLRFCFALVFFFAVGCAPKPSASNNDSPAPAGTWSGDYGPNAERRESINVDLRWQGAELRGTAHSGTRSMPLTRAIFQPDTGAITMEFDAQGNAGQTVHYVIEGKVSGDTMSGAWSHDNQRGDFKVTKQ